MIQYKNQFLTIFESALIRTTSTLIQTDDLILLVDPNWLPIEIEKTKQYLESIRNGRPLYLLFTHSDYDHILGYGAFPDAIVIASKAFVENEKKNEIIDQIITFDDEYYIKRNYPIHYPKVNYIVEKDGQALEVGGTRLVFYKAAGHNADGIFTIVEPLNIWIAGDYLSNIEFPIIYFDSRKYEQTLEKALQILGHHKTDFLIPGHGDFTDQISEMKKRILDSENYILRLKQSIDEGREFDFDKLIKQYEFAQIQRKYHDGNLHLISHEMGVKV